MDNLSEFLKRNFHFFVFVILQVLCIIMISKSMRYTSFVLANVCRTVVSPINEGWNKVLRHFDLEEENKALIAQNIKLLGQQDNAYIFKYDSLYSAIHEDTTTKKKIILYEYSAANVVYKTTDKTHNYIMIDKGRVDGITIDMAVLSANGVVGVVNDLTDHFAAVIPMLHPDSRISAKIIPANQIGTILWDGRNALYAQLHDIPQHVEVKVGDSIVTSGFSNIFPKDILVGTVATVKESKNSSFLDIQVKLATNFNNVNTVYLIRNLFTNETDSLKQNFKNE